MMAIKNHFKNIKIRGVVKNIKIEVRWDTAGQLWSNNTIDNSSN